MACGYLTQRGFSLRGVFSAACGDEGVCVQADLLFRSRVAVRP